MDRTLVIAQNTLSLIVVAAGVWKPFSWHSSWGFVVGGFLFLVAAGLGVLGVRDLGHQRTSSPRPLAATNLVCDGVYAWVRHPLYSSLILASLGWGLLWQSLLALVLSPGLWAILYFKARREEFYLNRLFPDYATYATRVPMLFPMPPKR